MCKSHDNNELRPCCCRAHSCRLLGRRLRCCRNGLCRRRLGPLALVAVAPAAFLILRGRREQLLLCRVRRVRRVERGHPRARVVRVEAVKSSIVKFV